ncbi:hypothetical protein HCK00_10510 [Streptomyces sp. PLAI1-29]|uniref:PD-(D/E)XK endonuclease-like domain-containing protein n=2 Tax=Streptomyces zingiberis TaxID=2053010 RepID=A0ABX1BTC4_9ACTN|nr:hypothetical protein [Streptomyces zingiberis]
MGAGADVSTDVDADGAVSGAPGSTMPAPVERHGPPPAAHRPGAAVGAAGEVPGEAVTVGPADAPADAETARGHGDHEGEERHERSEGREERGSGEHGREPAPGQVDPGAGRLPGQSRGPRPPAPRPGAVPGDAAAPGEPAAPGHAESAAGAGLLPEETRTVASWDRDLEALAGELRRSRASVREVPLPPVLSTYQLMRLAADPDGFARELARPLPGPPRPAARRGTRFHAWVESRFEEVPLPLLGPEELPGGFDDDGADGQEIADERELAALKDAFDRSPYARRTPYRVEEPVQITLAGRVVRGRIDAVYRERGPEGDRYEIVDWKTGRSRTADPLQLAVYRLAWAERAGVPLSAVSAAFLHVRSGEIVRPAGLPGRAELERILLGETERNGTEPGEPGPGGTRPGEPGSGGTEGRRQGGAGTDARGHGGTGRGPGGGDVRRR